MNRRKFFHQSAKAGASALGAFILLSRPASSADALLRADPDEFIFSRFKYLTLTPGINVWDYAPDSDEIFLEFLRRETNIRVSTLPFYERAVAVDDFVTLYKHPFLFMTGEGEFELSAAEAGALGEHFQRGGFVYADDCIAHKTGDLFFQSCFREFPKALPGCAWEAMPPTHEIYHCHFDISGGRSPYLGRGVNHPDHGLFIKNRMVSLLTSTDVHCAWKGNRWKRFQPDALKLGVNIVMYALTH